MRWVLILSVRFCHIAVAALGVALVIATCFAYASGTRPKTTITQEIRNPTLVSVHFIDVGDATAVLIRTGRRAVLIDAGDVFDGETVVQYLHSQRIQSLDCLVLTFPAPEHAGGLLTLLHYIHVKQFFPPAVESNDWVYQRVQALLNDYEVNIQQVSRDTVIELGDGIELRPLGPFAEIFAEGQFAPGDQSLGWVLTSGNVRFLFASDLTSSGEHLLLRVVNELRADVLMVANHGKRESTSTVFLEALQPRFAVISTSGPAGSLSQQVLSRLESKGIIVLRTDLLGTIVMDSDGRDIQWHAPKAR